MVETFNKIILFYFNVNVWWLPHYSYTTKLAKKTTIQVIMG